MAEVAQAFPSDMSLLVNRALGYSLLEPSAAATLQQNGPGRRPLLQLSDEGYQLLKLLNTF